MKTVLQKIDVRLLNQQKETIGKIINDKHIGLSVCETNHLAGVLNLLDSITDEIVPVEPYANTWE